jgi:hypothetical protein
MRKAGLIVITAALAFPFEAQAQVGPHDNLCSVGVKTDVQVRIGSTVLSVAPDAKIYPERSERMFVPGDVRFDCNVEARRLTNCRIISERPANFDFGPSALRMLESSAVTVAGPIPPEHVSGTVQFRIIDRGAGAPCPTRPE